MREIKFRAFTQGIMWRVIEIVYVLDGKIDLLLEDTKNQHLRDWAKNVELMEYTGIKDKHGTEIYEGDIVVTNKEELGADTVRYEAGAFRVYKGHLSSFCTDEYGLEVIGNMYEILSYWSRNEQS